MTDDLRHYVRIIENASGGIGVTPDTNTPHGTVVSVKSGSGFETAHRPFLAKEGAWHELEPISPRRGQPYSLLRQDGEIIPDAQMAEYAKQGLVGLLRQSTGGSTITSIFDLEALPSGACVCWDGNNVTYEKKDGLWYDPRDQKLYEPIYMLGMIDSDLCLRIV